MATLPLSPMASLIRVDDSGVVRIGATRVRLDTVVASYRNGRLSSNTPCAPWQMLTRQSLTSRCISKRSKNTWTSGRARLPTPVNLADQACDRRGMRERLLARQARHQPGS